MTEIGLRSVTHLKLAFRAYIPLNCSQGTHFETDWNMQQVVNEILFGVYTHSDFYYWLHFRCRFGRRICHGIIMISVALTFFLVLLIHKGKLFQQRNFNCTREKMAIKMLCKIFHKWFAWRDRRAFCIIFFHSFIQLKPYCGLCWPGPSFAD